MTKRIFRSICLVALVVLVASLILIMGITYTHYSKLQQNQLRTETSLVSQAVEVGGLSYLQNLRASHIANISATSTTPTMGLAREKIRLNTVCCRKDRRRTVPSGRRWAA